MSRLNPSIHVPYPSPTSHWCPTNQSVSLHSSTSHYHHWKSPSPTQAPCSNSPGLQLYFLSQADSIHLVTDSNRTHNHCDNRICMTKLAWTWGTLAQAQQVGILAMHLELGSLRLLSLTRGVSPCHVFQIVPPLVVTLLRPA